MNRAIYLPTFSAELIGFRKSFYVSYSINVKISQVSIYYTGIRCPYGLKKNNLIVNELIHGVGPSHLDVPNTKYGSKRYIGQR